MHAKFKRYTTKDTLTSVSFVVFSYLEMLVLLTFSVLLFFGTEIAYK